LPEGLGQTIEATYHGVGRVIEPYKLEEERAIAGKPSWLEPVPMVQEVLGGIRREEEPPD
jgi:hypothetical protein